MCVGALFCFAMDPHLKRAGTCLFEGVAVHCILIQRTARGAISLLRWPLGHFMFPPYWAQKYLIYGNGSKALRGQPRLDD